MRSKFQSRSPLSYQISNSCFGHVLSMFTFAFFTCLFAKLAKALTRWSLISTLAALKGIRPPADEKSRGGVLFAVMALRITPISACLRREITHASRRCRQCKQGMGSRQWWLIIVEEGLRLPALDHGDALSNREIDQVLDSSQRMLTLIVAP